jgi:hypothetical protein
MTGVRAAAAQRCGLECVCGQAASYCAVTQAAAYSASKLSVTLALRVGWQQQQRAALW